MKEQIYFYQNNPCTIIRDINEDFAEVCIDHQFASDMESTGQCEGCNVGDGNNKLSCTCDEHSWIIEEIQDEVNRILVIVEKRFLHKNPIEYFDIIRLKNKVLKGRVDLECTKELHEEWRSSVHILKQKCESLSLEAAAIESAIGTARTTRERAENGLSKLSDKYSDLVVAVDQYSINKLHITMGEYDNLLKRDEILRALEGGGVDNWQWYDESLKDVDRG